MSSCFICSNARINHSCQGGWYHLPYVTYECVKLACVYCFASNHLPVETDPEHVQKVLRVSCSKMDMAV